MHGSGNLGGHQLRRTEREFCVTLPTLQLAIAPEVMLIELDLRQVAVAGAFDDLRRDTMATMSHYSRVLKVVIDAPPDLHDQELAFWQGALGQELPKIYSAGYHGAFLRGTDLMLLMQRLESGAPTRLRSLPVIYLRYHSRHGLRKGAAAALSPSPCTRKGRRGGVLSRDLAEIQLG